MSEATPESEAVTESRVESRTQPDLNEYWRRNVRLIAGLFAVWFVVSFLMAILLAEPLSDVYLGNLPIPFWFAQQGSIIVFVVLIFVYARRMNKLDREFGVED
ncbi:DUF4212 domain-containing protein [Halomarina pelagica]|uniref:DUF4212 domain-containing protein n=1 Tax=Halomarina pelagica TaxID=2961599 RepID=UPI0020C4FA90|nr:DUF4212 domain-containing protein [Halomarina sp. BND7]